MSERTRLAYPIDGAALPNLLQRLVRKFVDEFRIAEKTNSPTLIEYEFSGVLIRRVRQEHSFENSDEPWWPAMHWWECFVTGIPGVAKFNLYAGTSSPGADEVYNYFEIDADDNTREKFTVAWRSIQLNHALKDRKVAHSEFMLKEWRDFFSHSRNLSFTGSFDWLQNYRLVQGEDTAPLTLICEGTSWLATTEGNVIAIQGALPADLNTVKETRQRNTTGAEPHGLELALKLLPGESGWSDLFRETTDACFLGAAWGEKIAVRAWRNARWLMRQSIGGNKWGGMRSAYWLQPVALKDAARFSLLAMFEIYGGGATMSFNPAENNTHYFYTVVGGIDPGEKAEFISRLGDVLKRDGWEME